MHVVQSPEDFDSVLASAEQNAVVGFFGEFSATARAAQPAFEAFCSKHPDLPALLVDVGKVKGLHKRFGVSQVPTAVLLKDGKTAKALVGPQTADLYDRAFVAPQQLARKDGDKPRQKNVVVYVSDTCSWCTRVKAYLRKRGVRFKEINVSRDPSQAQALRNKTGQTGVPQLDIEGQYVVGFDKQKIDTILGLAARPGDA